MEISNTVYNIALDEVIYVTTGKNYVRLLDSSNVEIGLNEVFFNNASGGEIDLSSPTTFAVSSGTTVKYVELYDEGYSSAWYTGTVDEETFATNGAYVFSNIIVGLGD